MNRSCEPEILDHLEPAHPDAVASRQDLRRINMLMGNERWIIRQLANDPEVARRGIVEWGAGSGSLAVKMRKYGPVTGVDLAPRPVALPSEVDWLETDVFENRAQGGVLVACLFLHHFEAGELARLGRLASRFERLIFVEPHRSHSAMMLGRCMLPFVNSVTRHDMIVSIRAGFIKGELASLMAMNSTDWKVVESCSWRGAIRVLMCRA